MGWNGTGREIRWTVSFKDYVKGGEEHVEQFQTELKAKAEKFIADAFREEFGDDIEKDMFSFMVGEHDSY